MPYYQRAGAQLYYEQHGNSGDAILFTHGASLNCQQWGAQVERFSRDHRVIIWDVRGHGQSSLPEGRVDAADFVRDAVGLLDHLQIEQAALCGLSMGGHISLQTAIRYPGRVSMLVLIGTPCSNSFNLCEQVVVPLNRLSGRLMPTKTQARLQAAVLSKFNPSIRSYLEQAFIDIPRANWLRIWDAVTRMESKHELQQVQCPTLLLVGDHDTLTGHQQPFMQQQIPRCELVMVPNAHHATNLDNPEAVNQAIARFL